MDVLDTETGAVTTIPLAYEVFSSLIIGKKAYIYSVTMRIPNHLYIFDPDADEGSELTTITINHQIVRAATNNTHIFFLSDGTARVRVLELATLTSTPFKRVQINEYVGNIFIIDNALIFTTATRFVSVSLVNDIINEGIFTDQRSPGAFAFINNEIYLAQSGSLAVFNGRDVVQYKIVNPFFGTVSAVAEHNGVIYFSGTFSNQQESVLTIDTKSLFVPVENLTTTQTFQLAAKGFHFVFSGEGIQYYSLRTREMQFYRYGLSFGNTMPNHITTVVGNQLLFVPIAQIHYHRFDFSTSEWTRHAMPRIFPGVSRGVVTNGDIALFIIFADSYIYNATSSEWTILPGVAEVYVQFVGGYIAFLRANVKLYDMATGEISTIEVRTNNMLSTAAHGDLLFMAGGIDEDNKFSDVVLIYNIRTKELRRERLSVPRSISAVLTINNYVIFASGEGSVRVASTRVDIYNTATSQWSALDLSQNVLSSVVQMTAFKDGVIIARQGRIELLNMTSWNLQILPIPYLTPIRGTPNVVVGSKILLFSASSDEAAISTYETSTGLAAQFLVRARIRGPLLTTDNYLIISTSGKPQVMEFPTMDSSILDTQLFIGQSTNITVDVRGRKLMPHWKHNGRSLQPNIDAPFTVQLTHVTQAANEGTYSLEISDRCNQKMVQQASLIIHGAPVLTKYIKESIIMCHDVAEITTAAVGEQVTYNWTIGHQHQVTSDPITTVVGSSFECNSEYQLCVLAANPSGSSLSCNRVHIIDHDLVFDGPRPLNPLPVWLRDGTATLAVRLLESYCDHLIWLKNGVPLNVSDDVLDVSIDVTDVEYNVEAQCGSSTLRSHSFRFTPVSSWTPLAVAGATIGGTVLVVGAVVAVLARRRMLAGKKHEIELELMLTQAKSEALKQDDGITIVRSTTWHWIPGDDFTYKPIDKTRYMVDYSSLSSLAKEAVKVSTWSQSEITFRLRDSKPTRKKKSFLKEELIGGSTIDIYPPQSPKYDVKVEPASFNIDSDEVIRVTVSSLLRMTTKCKICLMVVDEREKVYSAIEFKMSSAMSTWIDLDEVQTSGEYLGGGGFGSVTLGTYRGQEVAVKKLLSQYLTDDMKIEFEREITLMKDLRHPHIVQFVGASNVKDNLAIVIEYAPLGSLASVMQKQKLSLAMKITMLLETAKALQFLHLNGIIHRDIKPQNILVFSVEPRAQVHVKLTDFGTARFIAEDPTTITKNVGTTVYMAPEALGKNPRVDKSADVYSFAILLWSVLFEQSPFSEFAWDSEIEMHVKSGKRLQLPSDQDVSPTLTKLIEICWHHDPKERPSMASVVQQLLSLL
jgi:hypothetical protein